MDYKLKLISFKLCPYVQRSVITLLQKQVPFEIEYIDLGHKPEWFTALSPLGKVPVLLVNEQAVIFESAVINEFISEISPPSLLPEDPVCRAHNRAWIEYSSYILNTAFRMETAPNEAAFNEYRDRLHKQLAQLEQRLGGGPFFNGPAFSLIDASFAPFFMRLELYNRIASTRLTRDLPRVRSWSCALLAEPAVKDSVVPEYAALYRNFLTERSGYIHHLLDPEAPSSNHRGN